MFVRNRVFLLLVVGKSGYTLLVLEEWEVKDMCVLDGCVISYMMGRIGGRERDSRKKT